MPKDDKKGMIRAGKLLPLILKPETAQPAKPRTPIQLRFLTMPEDEEEVVFQHSVLCQTCIPYRDPGADVRLWDRRNGRLSMRIQAGTAWDAARETWVDVGLPYGPKPRLVMYHLNTEALRTQTAEVELEDSLTAFVKRTLSLDTKGRNIRTVKEQITRLAAADFRFGAGMDGHSLTVKGSVIDAFDLWTTKDEKQRLLWPSTVRFSSVYFQSLMQHAVPLNEAAVSRLSHSAMGLDIYTWLAQRLHRVDPKKPAFVPWVSLKEQFGQGYDRMNNFKRFFRAALAQVQEVYRAAKFEVNDRGMTLHNSTPPVLRRLIQIP